MRRVNNSCPRRAAWADWLLGRPAGRLAKGEEDESGSDC